MYLFFFIILGGAFLSSPYLIHSQFHAIYENEKQWIQLDNASIKLGQKDRSILNELEDIKNTLQALELIHHPLHLCKTCQIKDTLVEVKLQSLIKRAQHLILIDWQKIFLQITPHITFVKQFLRHPLSVQLAPCTTCKLSTKMIFNSERIQSQIGKNTVSLRKILKKWNYEIKTETNGHYSF